VDAGSNSPNGFEVESGAVSLCEIEQSFRSKTLPRIYALVPATMIECE